MDFKALIFDLDGTAIKAEYNALPSNTVIKAVEKAQEKIIVSIATGRTFIGCEKIIKKLEIKYPCIVSGGTELIDPKTGEILWTKKIKVEDIKKIIDICQPYLYEILFSKEIKGLSAQEKEIKNEENVVYIMNTKPEDAFQIIKNINLIENIVAHEAGSWTKGMVDIHVTHKDATKKNSLLKWMEVLRLNKQNVLAVGDNVNDLPLFEVAGYKIAVANAYEKLKLKADYIAPSMSEDGLAVVINKFILKI
jgi:HAD superfamily hydrolase (TIGR01484 family)